MRTNRVNVLKVELSEGYALTMNVAVRITTSVKRRGDLRPNTSFTDYEIILIDVVNNIMYVVILW